MKVIDRSSDTKKKYAPVKNRSSQTSFRADRNKALSEKEHDHYFDTCAFGGCRRAGSIDFGLLMCPWTSSTVASKERVLSFGEGSLQNTSDMRYFRHALMIQ